jgi:hypothetical protein
MDESDVVVLNGYGNSAFYLLKGADKCV